MISLHFIYKRHVRSSETDMNVRHPVVRAAPPGLSAPVPAASAPKIILGPVDPYKVSTTDRPMCRQASQRIYVIHTFLSIIQSSDLSSIPNMTLQTPKEALVFGASGISGWSVSIIGASSCRGNWLNATDRERMLVVPFAHRLLPGYWSEQSASDRRRLHVTD